MQAPLLRNARQCHSPCKFQICSQKCQRQGVLQNVKGAKDLITGLGLQTPSGKDMGLQPSAGTRDREVSAYIRLMIRAVRHARASQHARCLGPSYQGQSPALPLRGRRATSWLSKETMVLWLASSASFWRTIRDCCRLTRSYERIVSQGSRSCELLACFMRKAKYTSVRSGQITGLSATDLDKQ